MSRVHHSMPLARKLKQAVAVGVLTAALGMVPSLGQAVSGDPIEWQNTTIDQVVVEQELQAVLRRILNQNGVTVAFDDSVSGTVSLEFNNLPLQAAFNRLVEENQLDYRYDAGSNLVQMYAKKAQTRIRQFVAFSHATPAQIRAAVRRLGIDGDILVDDAARTVMIDGTKAQTKQVEDLVKQIDNSAKIRTERAEAAKVAADSRRKLERQKEMLRSLLDRESRVVRLDYANVAPITKTFHGESVVVPGIEQTLRRLLGDFDDNNAGATGGAAQAGEATIIKGSGFAAGVSVSIDTRTNSVILRGREDQLDQIEDVLNRLDQPVPMVEIEVIIVRAQKGLSESLGVNWAGEQLTAYRGSTSGVAGFNTGIEDADPGGVTNGVGDEQDFIPSTTVTSSSDTTNTSTNAAQSEEIPAIPDIGVSQSLLASYVYSGSRLALQVQLEAFESAEKSQTIAAPRLVTINNVSAKIERTASEFFNVSSSDGSSNDLVEVNVGLDMEIMPSVVLAQKQDEQDLVRMTISASNTSLGASSISVASESGQEMTTEVVVPVGRTFIMGGLFDDVRSDNMKGVPLLKDLPLLGGLFETNSHSDSLVETLFFITPRLIYPEDIQLEVDATRRYLNTRRLGLDAVRRELQDGVGGVSSALTLEEDE